MTRKRLHIKVSRSCNNNCLFCLDDRGLRTDTTLDEVRALLEKNRDLGEMLFTCGEPTLHPRLPEFIEMARSAGYRSIGLVTNGRRLGYPAYCEKILACGLGELTVSIHGSSARVHDGVTRAKGSFDQTLAGLRNAAARKSRFGLRLVTSTVVTARNLGHLPGILALLSGLEVDTMVLNVVEPSGEARRRFENLAPPYREFAAGIGKALRDFPGRSRVVVEGLPFCLCEGFLENAGLREEIHLLEGKELKALPPDRFHVKTATCAGCRVSHLCPGIFKVYAVSRGTSELSKL